MKGVILAGGSGTRLRPITHTTQKQLIPIVNKPVIKHVIEDLKSVGINDIGVVIGGGFPGDIKEFLGDGSTLGVDITYILQGEPLGLAHAVGCTEEFIGDDSFIVYFGDTILGDEITTTLVNSFDPDRHDTGLALQRVETPSRFGVVDINDGSISRILEKPDDPPTDLAYVGVIAFTPTVFEYIESVRPSWRGELELTEVLHKMATGDATISWNVVDDIWKDVGTPTDVVETNRLLQVDLEHEVWGEISPEADVTRPVSLGEGSVVSESATINGPVVIGKDTTIGPNAQIEPYTSIGDGCTVEGSRVSSSVIMNRAEIRGDQEIENSIIGSGAIINGSAADGPTQYVIGRDSVIEGEI